MNLVAPSTLDSIWFRHFADSLQLLSVVGDPSGTWIDIGAGAGFPGLPIAMELSQKRSGRVHLVERDNRKCAFLRQVSMETGAAASIFCGSMEDFREPFDGIQFITSRAVAPLDRLIDLGRAYIEAGALGVFLKGRHEVDDLDRHSHDKAFSIDTIPSKTDAASRVVLVRVRPEARS